MKNDFALVKIESRLYLLTPHTDPQTGQPDPRLHPIDRLEAEFLARQIFETLGLPLDSLHCPKHKP